MTATTYPDYILVAEHPQVLAEAFVVTMRRGSAEPPAYVPITRTIFGRRVAARVLDEITRLRPDQYRVADQYLFERPSR